MKVLCLSGGAFKGCVQVPIIKHLMKENKYDLIYGVSIGAMNGAMVAQGKFDELDEIWNSIEKRSDALPLKWWWPFNGLYSMDVLKSWADKYAKLDDLKIPFSAGVVSLNDGNYYILSTDNMSNNQEFAEAVIGSGSITGVMDTGTFKAAGKLHYAADGGFRTYIPIPPDIRYDQIDVVICDPYKRITKYREPSNIIDKVLRLIEIIKDETLYHDLENLERKCHHDNLKLRIFSPSKDTGSPMSISRAIKEERYRLGEGAIHNPVVYNY